MKKKTVINISLVISTYIPQSVGKNSKNKNKTIIHLIEHSSETHASLRTHPSLMSLLELVNLSNLCRKMNEVSHKRKFSNIIIPKKISIVIRFSVIIYVLLI